MSDTLKFTQEITLDIYATSYYAISAKQHDNATRFIKVTLTEAGKPIKVDTSLEAHFRALKPDGHSVENPATINEDGTITAELTAQTLAVDGITVADIVVLDSDKIVASATFTIDVGRAPVGNTAPSKDEYLVLVQATQDAREALKEAKAASEKANQEEAKRAAAEQGRVKAEQGRVTAETARSEAETKRAAAETARGEAETARDTSEQSRSDAETKRGEAEQARADEEAKRKQAESARVTAETQRGENETARKTAESERSEAEQARDAAERLRAEAESKRVNDFTDAIAKAEAARDAAKESETNAEDWANTSKSWAIGEGMGEKRHDEATDNSKYYAQQAAASATATAADAQTASDAATQAEAAQGKAEAAQTAAETAQAGAEQAKADLETARDTATDAAAKAEAAKADLEAARDAAQAAQTAAEAARDEAEEHSTTATEAANTASEQATAASGSAEAAKSDADRAEEAAAKAEAVTGFTLDDTVTAESSNPVKSSGIKAAIDEAVANVKIEMDETPTAESENAVKSKGIYTALEDKADKTEVEAGMAEVKETVTSEAGKIKGDTEKILNVLADMKPKRYGYRIKVSEPDPDTRVEYIYDAVGMTPAHMVFGEGETGHFEYGSWQNIWFVRDNYPCMLNKDGTEAYLLNPNDYSKKVDGTASEVTTGGSDGKNAMAAIPLVWVKRYQEGDYQYVIFCETQYDAGYKAYAHTREDGSIARHVYHAIYKGSIDGAVASGTLRSLSGKYPENTSTADQELAAAKKNGDGFTLRTWALQSLIADLCTLISKSTNSQAKFGNGNQNRGSNTSAEVHYGERQCGELDTKGQFYGYNTANQSVKVFHIENFWADRWERLVGLLYRNGEFLVKMTPENGGYNFTGAGYAGTGVGLPAASNNWQKTTVQTDAGRFPTAFSASDATYETDFCWWNSAIVSVAVAGGACDIGSGCGARCLTVNALASWSVWSFGASLSYVGFP